MSVTYIGVRDNDIRLYGPGFPHDGLIYQHAVGNQWVGSVVVGPGGTSAGSTNGEGSSSPNSTNQGTVPSIPPDATTAAKQAAVVQYFISHQYSYWSNNNPNRLTIGTSATDCSGAVYIAYMAVLGLDTGSYTGQEYTFGANGTNGGELIVPIKSATDWNSDDSTALQAADLIIFGTHANPMPLPGAHVIMVTDPPSQAYSHGGPGTGPNERTLPGYITSSEWWQVAVVRFLH